MVDITNTFQKYIVINQDPRIGVGVPADLGCVGLWDKGATTDVFIKTSGQTHVGWTFVKTKASPLADTTPEEIIIDMLLGIPSSEKGAPNGVPTLDPTGHIPASQLPSPMPMSSTKWFDIIYKNGTVLPLSVPRAYYGVVLYNATAIFNDGTNLRKYIAYYGGGAGAETYAAFSDDGITFDTETLITGLVGVGYHASCIIVAGIIHYFYWDTTGSIYRPQSCRHATFDPSITCASALSDAPLTGTYIAGPSGGGNIRAGTYGVDQAFYNATPTNNPANPYSYQWCIIHNGTDGNQEGVLFATSSDGYNFSPWNALVEVISRGVGLWDAWIGRMITWIDSVGLYHAFYSGGKGTGAGEDSNFAGGIGYATSKDGIAWVKHPFNPIMYKTESFKSWKRCYCPWIIKDANGYHLYYSVKNNAGTYKLAIADFDGFI